MSNSPGASDRLGSPPMQNNGLPLKSKIKAKKSLFFKQARLNKSNNALGVVAENNGSYMQNSAAIEEKDFEEDEEEKRAGNSNDCSPAFGNKIIMVDDIAPKKPLRTTI